ncbi:MAG TPA: hypothetical protein VFO39_02230 [Candidatus Sulfotelmatobacter sp.]|nr:hypothetical protein [Candidatus Sulfotelmatobacter sp.]
MSGTFANFNAWQATVQANPDGNPAYVGIGNGSDSGFPPASGHNFNGTATSFVGFAYNPGAFGGSTNWVLLSFSDPLDTGSGFSHGDTGIPYDSTPHVFKIIQACPHSGSADVFIDGTLFSTGGAFPVGSEIANNPSSVTLTSESFGSFTSVNVTALDFSGCNSSPVLSVTPASLSFQANGIPGNYPTQNLTISNTGGGSFSFTITTDANAPLSCFVTISPASGTVTTSQTVQIGINSEVVGVSALATNVTGPLGPTIAKTQATVLTVTASGTTGSPQTVSVSLAPILRISPGINQTVFDVGRFGGGVAFEF